MWQELLHLFRGIAVFREAGLVHGRAQEHIAVVAEGVRAGVVQPAAACKTWQQHTMTGRALRMIAGDMDGLTPLVSTVPHAAFQEKQRYTAHFKHMRTLVWWTRLAMGHSLS